MTEPWAGSAETALIRPSPESESSPLIAYLSTEAGLARRSLVAMPIGPHGWRGTSRVLAGRDDAELEALDADDAGRLLLLVWNVAGRSSVELLDTASGVRSEVEGVPGFVVTNPVISRDGRSVLLTVEGPARPANSGGSTPCRARGRG
ncbi:hypothetical protein GCM10025867_25310 [Frondihabitans sucicola]|uniref:Uncharacterized protein n=1 Tax=Frondihabitans sucicola TaxID=1268041 RepID=A0ABN6XZ43_9MICO|nr:hypothetical protein [Frondihabitans sucicola]BDZ50290.1 hypothetical protein GCM10025867_25310 [Frondihabitans sucicola]